MVAINTPYVSPYADNAAALAVHDAERRYREAVQRGDDHDIIMLRLRAWLALDNARSV